MRAQRNGRHDPCSSLKAPTQLPLTVTPQTQEAPGQADIQVLVSQCDKCSI